MKNTNSTLARTHKHKINNDILRQLFAVVCRVRIYFRIIFRFPPYHHPPECKYIVHEKFMFYTFRIPCCVSSCLFPSSRKLMTLYGYSLYRHTRFTGKMAHPVQTACTCALFVGSVFGGNVWSMLVKKARMNVSETRGENTCPTRMNVSKYHSWIIIIMIISQFWR